MEKINFKDETFVELARKHATEPLVIVTKFGETTDAIKINPTFQLILRPLGRLEKMSSEDVAKLGMRAPSQMVEDAEIVDEVEPLEVSGYPAAHYAMKYTLRTTTGDVFPTLADAWIVKRGAYILMFGGSGPPQ